jgi:hypothetical protein
MTPGLDTVSVQCLDTQVAVEAAATVSFRKSAPEHFKDVRGRVRQVE